MDIGMFAAVYQGMKIPEPDRAARYLFHISSFRLRGYWIPFEKKEHGKDHHFKDGTSFEKNKKSLFYAQRWAG